MSADRPLDDRLREFSQGNLWYLFTDSDEAPLSDAELETLREFPAVLNIFYR